MKKMIGASVLVVMLLVGFVSAYQGDPTTVGPNFDPKIHEQVEAAIGASDYDAWISIRTANDLPMNGKIFQVINEDNFDVFAEMHEAREADDIERADELRAELGLGQGRMNRDASGQRKMGRDGSGQGTGFEVKGQRNNQMRQNCLIE